MNVYKIAYDTRWADDTWEHETKKILAKDAEAAISKCRARVMAEKYTHPDTKETVKRVAFRLQAVEYITDTD